MKEFTISWGKSRQPRKDSWNASTKKGRGDRQTVKETDLFLFQKKKRNKNHDTESINVILEKKKKDVLRWILSSWKTEGHVQWTHMF